MKQMLQDTRTELQETQNELKSTNEDIQREKEKGKKKKKVAVRPTTRVNRKMFKDYSSWRELKIWGRGYINWEGWSYGVTLNSTQLIKGPFAFVITAP